MMIYDDYDDHRQFIYVTVLHFKDLKNSFDDNKKWKMASGFKFTVRPV